MGRPSPAASTSSNGVSDKRAALLSAALELFARNGLHDVSTSAIARRAGVGKGTLFLYFETKEQLLNELYLDVARQYVEAVQAEADASSVGGDSLRIFWLAYARWYLDHGDAATFMLQCEVSSVLTPESHERKQNMEEKMARAYFSDLVDRLDGSLLRYVAYALVAGPIQVLGQMRDKREIEITDDLLEQTYACVERALQPLE